MGFLDFRPDEKIIIKQSTITRSSDFGSPIDTPTTLATVWASVEDYLELKQGIESRRAEKETVISRKRVIIRYRADITERDTLVIRGVNHDITNISRMKDEGRKFLLEIVCLKAE